MARAAKKIALGDLHCCSFSRMEGVCCESRTAISEPRILLLWGLASVRSKHRCYDKSGIEVSQVVGATVV